MLGGFGSKSGRREIYGKGVFWGEHGENIVYS
jgi:hypothetical protein